jgi:hypothetical protein
MALSASILDTLSQATLFVRAALSSASLTRVMVLFHTTTTSWAEASVERTAVAWAHQQCYESKSKGV